MDLESNLLPRLARTLKQKSWWFNSTFQNLLTGVWLDKKVLEQKEEGLARVAELEGKKEPPDDWHSMMYLALSIVLYGKGVDLRREIVIGAMPPRADFLIKKDDPGVDLGLAIFGHFLKMNVVEYKGPGDDLGEEELWQAVIYLAAQARESISKKEATSDDFTITLFRKAKPVQLLKDLGDRAKADEVKGISITLMAGRSVSPPRLW
ncbi:MAG: hypothetical protein IIY58_02635 [Aeriscardovia sp.]|nr:hypothetical protein [Aeriscardovia sp.]